MMMTELNEAIEALKGAPKVNIKGKEYSQVATRVEYFRMYFGFAYGIVTEMLDSYDPDILRVKAAVVDTATGAVVATGHAEEDRRVGKINATSALENAETSAIGRALAAFGLMGGEYASGNEMVQAGAYQPDPRQSVSGGPPNMNQLERNWQYRIEADPNEKSMVNSGRPDVIPHIPEVAPRISHVPQFQQWTDMLGEVSKVSDHIVHVNTIDDLTRYWTELTDFLKVVQEKDAPLFSELRAAFSVRNKQLRGKGNV